MDQHKAKIVEKLVETLCLVIGTEDTKVLNLPKDIVSKQAKDEFKKFSSPDFSALNKLKSPGTFKPDPNLFLDDPLSDSELPLPKQLKMLEDKKPPIGAVPIKPKMLADNPSPTTPLLPDSKLEHTDLDVSTPSLELPVVTRHLPQTGGRRKKTKRRPKKSKSSKRKSSRKRLSKKKYI